VEDTRTGSLWYRVVHPMLAEAAYDLVPVVVRRRLHARLADAVERHRPDDVRLLAAHVRGAGDQIDPAHALMVLTAATRADLARLAGEEACASAGAGLEIARRLGRRDAVHELTGAYAEACELAGRVQDALPGWLDAAASAADPGAQARRLTRAAVIAWDLGRLADAHGYLDAADRALAAVSPRPERVDLEGVRMRFAARAGDPAALRDSIARLEGLPAIGSSRSRAAVLFARLLLALHTGRFLDGLRIADEIVAFARDDRSVLVADALLRPLITVRLCWGDLAGARALAEEGIQLARQTGVPSLEIIHDALLALVDGLAGEWPAALRRTFDALELAHRVGVPRAATMVLTAQAVVLVRRGDVDEAADRISEARRLFGIRPEADRSVFAVVDLVEGMVALARGEVDRALDIATRATKGAPFPPLALALLGDAQAAAGDAKSASDTASALAALGPGAPYPAALAAWVSGLAAGARRHPPRAVAALGQLDHAVTGFADLGMPYEEAVARLDRASVRRAAGYPADDIAREVADSLQVLDRLQAKPQADRARSLLRELGRRPAPPTRDGSRRLSAREEEVARLIAQGLSNAEVAQRLFISTRTVTTHLQHIYRRLDVPSRAALIRYVLEASPPSEGTS
jgi:DNA-binding CsgD family transcriptional regulator/tetratricopeptide (TPR) repeat protein